jgi:hypothetical protein
MVLEVRGINFLSFSAPARGCGYRSRTSFKQRTKHHQRWETLELVAYNVLYANANYFYYILYLAPTAQSRFNSPAT